MSTVRTLLADEHPEFSQFVETFLDADFEVVGRVSDGRSLFEAALKLRPHLILTDISLPTLDGIEAAKNLKKSGCTSRIVFLTVDDDPDFARACLAAGAFGFVSKQRIPTDLLPAIREALAGHIFVSPMRTRVTG